MQVTINNWKCYREFCPFDNCITTVLQASDLTIFATSVLREREVVGPIHGAATDQSLLKLVVVAFVIQLCDEKNLTFVDCCAKIVVNSS